MVECTLVGEIEVKDSNPFSLAKPLHQNVAAGAGSSTPEPLVSLLDVHSAGIGKSIHETFVAPKVLRTSPVFGWSNLRKVQEERKQRLADLVDPHFMPLCVQFGFDWLKAIKWMERNHADLY